MAMSRRRGEELMNDIAIKQLLDYEEKLFNKEKRFSFFGSWNGNGNGNGDV